MAGRDSHPREQSEEQPDFERLVELHYASLYRFALSLTRSETDSADLVQETFLTWARKGHQLLDAARVKAWLFTTLHRGFLQRHRHAARFPHLDLAEVESELPACSPELINQLDGRSLAELLGKVDLQFQAAVALFYLEDYSYREIAGILDVPLGTVKSRIARGLVQLRALIGQARPVPDGVQEDQP